MISQCSVCDEPYSTKDFIEAKKRVCPGCKAKQPVSVEGGACSVERNNKTKAAGPELKPAPKSNGMAPSTFIPKPDNKFNQRPLVWAK